MKKRRFRLDRILLILIAGISLRYIFDDMLEYHFSDFGYMKLHQQNKNILSYKDSAGVVRKLSYEALSPFKRGGKAVLELPHDHQLYRDYHHAIKQFPSVRSCLYSEEQYKNQPNLTRIDWDKIDVKEDAEVCLFRIADSYEEPEEMENWFYFQGIPYKPTKQHSQVDESRHILSANWATRLHGPLYYPNIFAKWLINSPIPLIKVWGESLSVYYNEDNSIHSTHASRTVK